MYKGGELTFIMKVIKKMASPIHSGNNGLNCEKIQNGPLGKCEFF